MNPDVQAKIIKSIKDISAEELRLLYNNAALCSVSSADCQSDGRKREVDFRFVDSGKHLLAFEDNVVLDSSAKYVVQLQERFLWPATWRLEGRPRITWKLIARCLR